MGFGFNFFIILFLIPFTGVLLLVWLISRKAIVGKVIGLMWLGIIGFAILVSMLNWLTSNTKLDKEDYHGEYIVNRDYFKGEQADWQYNHFRFEIKENDSIFFYVTDYEKIVETYHGTISTSTTHSSARLKINMDAPTHHIMIRNPTTYRSTWSFYLVFTSHKFYNVFFKKGKWKAIE